MTEHGPTADFEVLFAHCAEITAALELEEVVQATLSSTSRLLTCDQIVISLVHDGRIEVLAADPPVAVGIKRSGLPVGSGLVGRAVDERTTIYSPDLTEDPRAAETRGRWGEDDRSVLAVPLALGNEIIGALHAISKEVDAFSERDRARLLALAPAVATAMRNALVLERERETWAHHRKLDEQKTAFMQLATRALQHPLDEVDALVRRIGDIPPGQGAEAAEALLERCRRLAHQIEEVLELSLKDSSEILLPSEQV